MWALVLEMAGLALDHWIPGKRELSGVTVSLPGWGWRLPPPFSGWGFSVHSACQNVRTPGLWRFFSHFQKSCSTCHVWVREGILNIFLHTGAESGFLSPVSAFLGEPSCCPPRAPWGEGSPWSGPLLSNQDGCCCLPRYVLQTASAGTVGAWVGLHCVWLHLFRREGKSRRGCGPGFPDAVPPLFPELSSSQRSRDVWSHLERNH